MAEQALSGIDIFFRIWAVVGPLLAGAASQIWERRNKIVDREFEAKRELVKLEKEVDIARQESIEENAKQRYLETKSCYLRFMSSSQEYVRKQSEKMTNPNDMELRAAASKANDEFIRSFQEVTLMSNQAIEEPSLRLYNATLSIPRVFNAPEPEGYDEKLQEYREARSEFNSLAKTHLRKLETFPKLGET